MSTPILSMQPLGFPWATIDPFLFCVHHDDRYPEGNAQFGPRGSLAGRQIGQDFAGKDGWRMHHGSTVPGFPSHPHRGLTTEVSSIAGRLGPDASEATLSPPPDSWASQSEADLAIWTLKMAPGACWRLPAAAGPATRRRPYFFKHGAERVRLARHADGRVETRPWQAAGAD